MIERSQERQRAEQEVEAILNTARLVAVVPLALRLGIGLFNHRVADWLYTQLTCGTRSKWHLLNENLRQIEIAEDFPVARLYVETVKDLSDKVPMNLKRQAYYPYAGIDVFWAAGFESLIMGDKNYNISKDDPTNWWSIDDYQSESIFNLLERLKKHDLIPAHHEVALLKEDSDHNDAALYTYNQPTCTLVYKAGHRLAPFIEEKFKSRRLEYGAIIVSNDEPTDCKSLENLLLRLNYHKVYEPEITFEQNPWAIGIRSPRVFLHNLY